MMRLGLLGFALSIAAATSAAEIHNYSDVTLSADGARIAAIEIADRHSSHAVVVLRSSGDGRILRRIDPCPRCQYAGLRFAGDGQLAFLGRDRDAGTSTLYVADRGDPMPVAVIAGLAQNPRFAPDGRRIALLVTLGATKETGATQAGARQVGEIGEKADAQQLAIVETVVREPVTAVRPLSPAGRYIYEYDWAPDGHTLIVSSAPGDGDANWWTATLDAVDATTGALRPIARPTTQFRMPAVSPDGKWVAYIGGLMSDYGSVGGDVWRVPLTGGVPQNLTAEARTTYTSLAWTAGGLRASTLQGGRMGAAAVTEKGGQSLFAQPVALNAGGGRIAWSQDGRTLATVMQDYTTPPAVHAGEPARLRKITNDNDSLSPQIAARSVNWFNEGREMQGWFLSPLKPVPGKAPMIVAVHGGPSAATSPRYFHGSADTYLLDAGYHVFYPNPRGSYGQGEAFTAANRRDFGGGDLRDILAGIDAVERVAPIDDARLGLQGCSYGGFMAMFANTQTNRFKAIVAGAGISNWISYYGTNGIDQWMIPFFGKSAYDDPKAYTDISAVYQVAKARTPTFIYVGERDIEVPPTQSLEWWKALRAKDVPAKLIIYPDAGHCVTAPEQAADVRAHALNWYATYLGAPAKRR